MSSAEAVAGGARVRQLNRSFACLLYMVQRFETRHAEVVNVKEHNNARKQQLQLALDDGALILPGAPNVAPVTTWDGAFGMWL